MRQITAYDITGITRPEAKCLPEEYRALSDSLFDTWNSVRARNVELSTYYRMHNAMKDLGISIPPQLTHVNSVVGWADKAVRVMAVRSQFDSYTTKYGALDNLNRLTRQNGLQTLYADVCRSSLVHGVSFMSVMAGNQRQPSAVVRGFSANQCAALWDKDAHAISCGVVLADVDMSGNPTRYVYHFPDAVLDVRRDGNVWSCTAQPNPHGVPLLVPFIFEPDLDRPLGHSRITPEVMGIIDKAMRDVLRMEVGSEFFTAPQRYILGADAQLFSVDSDDDVDDEGDLVIDQNKLMRAYLGSILAITRDENDEIPTVGQFPAGDANNFIQVFENDAQRFSGATNVPLTQLGVLSNNYTSSDALSATNDPLILDVEAMNRRNKESMEQVARLMLAIDEGVTVDELPEDEKAVIAHFNDPSMPTFSARADGWTKIASVDDSIVGTDVFYEGLGLPAETIGRLNAEKSASASRQAYDAIFSGEQQ